MEGARTSRGRRCTSRRWGWGELWVARDEKLASGVRGHNNHMRCYLGHGACALLQPSCASCRCTQPCSVSQLQFPNWCKAGMEEGWVRKERGGTAGAQMAGGTHQQLRSELKKATSQPLAGGRSPKKPPKSHVCCGVRHGPLSGLRHTHLPSALPMSRFSLVICACGFVSVPRVAASHRRQEDERQGSCTVVQSRGDWQGWPREQRRATFRYGGPASATAHVPECGRPARAGGSRA